MTILKRTISDTCQGRGQRQATQGATTRKRTIPDTRQGGRQRQATQEATTAKRPILYTRHSVRNNDTSSFRSRKPYYFLQIRRI